MIRGRRYICLILGVLLALQPCAAYATSTISSVIRLDISDGSIKGEDADYTFVLPKSWQNSSVTVNRERPGQQSQFLDKLIFLYMPLDKISKPMVFATLYVYENRSGVKLEGSRKLLETDKYIFMFDSTSKNNFTDVADKSLFGQYIEGAGNDYIMASQIEVPKSQRRLNYNTVTVNGRLLRGSAIQNINGTVYIPVREACNALGYSVDWNAADSTVVIYQGSERYTISTPGSSTRQNYATIIVDSKAYVTSVFFMRALNANIEVDGYNNVVISSKGQ